MIALDVFLNGDKAWPDLADRRDDIIHLTGEGDMMGVAVLDRGTTSGKPSVALRLDLPGGKVVIAETTARLFCTAAKAIMAKYPDLFEDAP